MSKDGGPAFSSIAIHVNGNGDPVQFGDPGMSLRDYFAGQALAGIVANGYFGDYNGVVDGIRGGNNEAKVAYTLADAMLRARAIAEGERK